MWLVRCFTFSGYAHAAEVVNVRPRAPKPVLVIEAAPGGVRARWVAVDAFRWSTGGPLDAILTQEIRANLVKRANSMLYTGYDWPSIARFVPRFFYAKLKSERADHPDTKLFCSELIVWNRYEERRFSPLLDLFPTTAPGDISPGMLEPWCPKSPGGKP